MSFLRSNRFGFFLAALMFAGFGIWMLVDPGLMAGEGGRLSVNRKVLGAIWGSVAGVILLLIGVANLAAGIVRRGDAEL